MKGRWHNDCSGPESSDHAEEALANEGPTCRAKGEPQGGVSRLMEFRPLFTDFF